MELPSEFAILCKDEKEAQICIDWAKRNKLDFNSNEGYKYSKIEYCYFIRNNKQYWFWRNKDDSELIPLTSLTEEQGEIIGYECPTDLYGDKIKKGYIYINAGDDEISDFYYKPASMDGNYDLTDFLLPKEIVETWKPVYKKVKTQREIDHEMIDKVNHEFMNFSNPKFRWFSDYLKANNYAIVKKEYTD